MQAFMAEEEGRDAVLGIFRYLSLVVPDLTPEALHRNLCTLAPDVEEIVMTTLAERWMAQGEARGRAEGEARGRAEGELEGARSLLLCQLELKFGSLPDDARVLVESGDAEQVRKWSLRLVAASSLAEVLSVGAGLP
jgi:hypothetical protein